MRKRQRLYSGVALPEWVYSVKQGRYWYYQRRRGHPNHGPNIALPEPGTPEFLEKLAEIKRGHARPDEGTIEALIADYKAHGKYTNLSESSRETYAVALGYISKRWGPLRADGLTAPAIQAFVDEVFGARPSMGNVTLAVLRTLLKFGVPRGYLSLNPAREVEAPDLEPRTARPWPEHIWQRVVVEGPTEISRLAYLGRAIGERISDLVKLKPGHRDGTGIITNIKKIKADGHWCPLTADNIAVIDSWPVFPTATYIADEKGRAFRPETLRKRFNTYRDSDPELRAAGIKIHDLRAMAVCDRRTSGLAHQVISAQIGMSLKHVMHYSRHIDQRLAAGWNPERERNKDASAL